MKAIRKCGPLTKIFLCIVFASIILAIIHSFTETSVKEALNNVNGWSAERDEQSLTILHNNKPLVTIDKNTGLNLGKLAKKSQFHSHTGNKNIHVPSGTGSQGARGKPGPRGYDGQSGIVGQVGVGQVGRSGQRGPAGPRGAMGPTGAIGATGAAGGPAYSWKLDKGWLQSYGPRGQYSGNQVGYVRQIRLAPGAACEQNNTCKPSDIANKSGASGACASGKCSGSRPRVASKLGGIEGCKEYCEKNSWCKAVNVFNQTEWELALYKWGWDYNKAKVAKFGWDTPRRINDGVGRKSVAREEKKIASGDAAILCHFANTTARASPRVTGYDMYEYPELSARDPRYTVRPPLWILTRN